jgi:hypothetical protein
MAFFIVTAMKTSNITLLCLLYKLVLYIRKSIRQYGSGPYPKLELQNLLRWERRPSCRGRKAQMFPLPMSKMISV